MIITESFVWINFPKTASTFARECLRELYRIPCWNLAKKKRFKGRWIKEINMPLIFAPDIPRFGKPTPHGVVRQIPDEYNKLKILSAVRDPVERLLSLYHYGDWKKNDALIDSIETINIRYPNFPDIQFEEFYEYLYEKKRYVSVNNNKYAIGRQSYSLLNFFCNRENIEDNNKIKFDSWEKLAEIFNKVIFISAKNISQNLYNNLLKLGYSQKDLEFILKKDKINVSNKDYNIQLNNELKKNIYSSEWVLDTIHNSSGNIKPEEFLDRAIKFEK
jgi:hypothetical protein